jgi:hypothetical protein
MKQLFLIALLFSSFSQSFSQKNTAIKPFAQGAFGTSFSKETLVGGAELQAGLRVSDLFTSVGYIASFDQAFPELFNVRIGYMYDERFIAYAGYVRVVESTVMKIQNSNAWQIGLQRNISYYDRGTMYASATYTHKQCISINFGFTFNLVKKDYE